MVRPPMTAVASGACVSEPLPSAERERQHAQNGRAGRHQDRAQTGRAGGQHRLIALQSRAPQLVGVVDQQDAVLDDDADQQQQADERGQAEGAPGQEQRQHDADGGERHRHQNRQRIDERLELRGEQHIDQRDRHADGEAQTGELSLLLLLVQPQIPVVAGRKLVAVAAAFVRSAWISLCGRALRDRR